MWKSGCLIKSHWFPLGKAAELYGINVAPILTGLTGLPKDLLHSHVSCGRASDKLSSSRENTSISPAPASINF